MPKTWSRIFPGQAQQVIEARRFVASLLEGEDANLAEDAVLVVSELATNAVRHTRSGESHGWFLVAVGFGDDLLRIEVVDQGGSKEPMMRSVNASVEESGRGLLLVSACAKNWGVKDRYAGRRCIWVDLARVRA